MARARRDVNLTPSVIGVLNTDGQTPQEIYVTAAGEVLVSGAGGGSGNGAILDGADSAIKATVFDYTNSNPLGVVLRDTNGDYVSVGGGTQYTEDAAAAANPVGTVVNLIRQDTPADEVSANGDNISQRGTKYGAGYVQILSSTGSFVDSFGGGTQYADGAVRGTATGTIAMVDDGTNIQSLSGDSSGRLNVNNISGTVSLPTGAATSAKQDTGNTSLSSIDTKLTDVATQTTLATRLSESDFDTKVGSLTETAPATDTASSGLNGRLQRLAQRLTSLIALLPTSLGQKTKANSLAVTLASDQDALPITDNGGSLTVDGTVTVTGVSTLAEQQTQTTALQLIDDTVATLGTTTYTEATTKGNVIGAVRRDANTTLVDTTNEVAPLQVNATGELKVAQIQPLPAGTNAIGKLSANSGVDIGDVDVLTINGVAPAFNTGVRGATVQRVTIATDDVVPVTDNGGSLTVDYATTGSGTATGALRVELPTNGTGVVGLNTGSNIVGRVGIDQTTPGTTNATSLAQLGANTVATGNGASSTGVLRVAQVNDGTGVLATVSTVTSLTQMNGQAISMGTGVRAAGTQRVTIATDDVVPASQSGTWTVQPGNTANTTPWLTSSIPAASGGLSKFHLISAATTNATNIKASAGQVYGWAIFNTTASAKYVKFHNTAGTPTAGTGVTDTLMIPANGGTNIEFSMGIAFSTGIAITTVTGIADSDSAAVALNDLIIQVYYK